jgi:transcription antitermination factor NusA-like protein
MQKCKENWHENIKIIQNSKNTTNTVTNAIKTLHVWQLKCTEVPNSCTVTII